VVVFRGGMFGGGRHRSVLLVEIARPRQSRRGSPSFRIRLTTNIPSIRPRGQPRCRSRLERPIHDNLRGGGHHSEFRVTRSS
jgi:hypothetical protein